MNFYLNDISIPIKAGLEFNQTYELIGGSVTQRMQSGKAVKQTHFRKLRTTLSGQGWVPAGLDGLDYNNPVVLKCALPRSIGSVSNQFTIPAERRQDAGFEVKGYALIGSELIETAFTLNANIAVLNSVMGASSYQVHYYPEIIVFAEPPQTQGNVSDAEFSWSLICEEV